MQILTAAFHIHTCVYIGVRVYMCACIISISLYVYFCLSKYYHECTSYNHRALNLKGILEFNSVQSRLLPYPSNNMLSSSPTDSCGLNSAFSINTMLELPAAFKPVDNLPSSSHSLYHGFHEAHPPGAPPRGLGSNSPSSLRILPVM